MGGGSHTHLLKVNTDVYIYTVEKVGMATWVFWIRVKEGACVGSCCISVRGVQRKMSLDLEFVLSFRGGGVCAFIYIYIFLCTF